MGKAWAIRPAGRLPWRSRSITARRVGSAIALKVTSVEYVAERLRICLTIRLHKRNCQSHPGLSKAGTPSGCPKIYSHSAITAEVASSNFDTTQVVTALKDEEFHG